MAPLGIRSLMTCVLVASLAPGAFAHSTTKRTVPKSGSVLPASPEEVVIEFNEPARLTSVVVSAGQSERKLEFEPSGSATSFVAKAPKLAEGRSEIKWKALSKDGHPINGTIVVVIKPGAEPKPPAAAPDHKH